MDDSSKLLRAYVRTLADNADSTRIPKEVDIVFSGGAFNGFMGYGVMLYIKALFVKHGVMVHRVSGCSIGSLLAAFVFADAATIEADPRPASFENRPLATPKRIAAAIVAPTKPPVADAPLNALLNINENACGI